MNTFQTIILISLIGNVLSGMVVLGLNPNRRLNRYFFLSTLLITVWLLCMLAVTVQYLGMLLFWTRQVSAAALFLPLGFYILRLAIMEPDLRAWQLWYRLRYHLLAACAVALLCQTPFFVRATSFSGPDGSIPVSDYGFGIYPFILYFLIMAIGMVISIRSTFRSCSGIRLIESQFLLLGWFTGFSFGVIVFVAGILTGRQEITQFLPLFALILDGFVSYGIATKRILSVSEVLQRVTAYALVAVILAVEYVVVLAVGQALFAPVLENAERFSRLFATLVVAFSVVPVENWMRLLSKRIIVHDLVSSEGLLARAGGMIREISLEDELIPNFTKLVCEAFGAPKACLLREESDGRFVQAYPLVRAEDRLGLSDTDDLLVLLREEQCALTASTLQRMRPVPAVRQALDTLQGHGWDLTVGGFIRGRLKAVLLLKARRSDRIYDLRDQRALQILCDQFAVALENSNLYTEVQNARIYNEILLDALTSGIIAMDTDGVVTVFNQIAQKITGLESPLLVGKHISRLPAPLADPLLATLATHMAFQDQEVILPVQDHSIPLRVSGTPFHSHTGQLLGVLAIFSDLSELKQMEEQIRRSDRLSSIGTLSAGMAHEIKNPLVTIKTFTQLLPEQYEDAAFRETFFELVGQEVIRIDTLVNQLLRFARPVKGNLQPISLHLSIEGALRLVAQQLTHSGIRLEKHLEARRDCINADTEQLNQAFVNFLLNAIDAMEPGGVLVVRSKLVQEHAEALAASRNRSPSAAIQLEIEDNGSGIAPGDVSRIFDPFFTTKESGVGLGLSVSHGIIQEHKGSVQVRTAKGEGTTFILRFPLYGDKSGTGRKA